MAMGTWRVDPQENRDLQVASGVDPTKLLGETGTTKKTRTASKTPAKNYQYPFHRSAAESEDTLLIKAIKYIPPTSNLGKGTRNKENIASGKSSAAYSKQANDINDSNSGITITGGPNGIEFRNAGGMDRRIEKGYSSDPAGFQQKIKYYIELPIPQQISDSTSVSWGQDSMNILQAAAAGIAQGITDSKGPGDFANKMQTVMNSLDFTGVSEDTVRSIKTALAGKAVDTLGANVNANSLLGRATGQILNSNLELLFQGVTLRSFPFNITFSPRSQPESQRVKDIIRALKTSMAPKRGDNAFGMNGGIFLNPPDLFLIRYLSNGKDHPFLNAFKPCALTNMSVNYTGAGTYATYGDSTPVNIKVSLMFKETNPVYAEDYANAPGVGF